VEERKSNTLPWGDRTRNEQIRARNARIRPRRGEGKNELGQPRLQRQGLSHRPVTLAKIGGGRILISSEIQGTRSANTKLGKDMPGEHTLLEGGS